MIKFIDKTDITDYSDAKLPFFTKCNDGMKLYYRNPDDSVSFIDMNTGSRMYCYSSLKEVIRNFLPDEHIVQTTIICYPYCPLSHT